MRRKRSRASPATGLLTYSVDVPDGLEAEVDAEQVRRSVLNLLANAFSRSRSAQSSLPIAR